MKPILFNTEMVSAIRDGKKTVMRRVVKKLTKRLTTGENALVLAAAACSPYQPGDILYVRETWCDNVDYDLYPFETERFLYRADRTEKELPAPEWFYGWRPSIHMPREAARIFLRVTDVYLGKLWDIDGAGVLSEGVDNGSSNPKMGKRWENMQRMAFSEIWNRTLPPKDRDRYGWDANPWVWVIEFERIDKETALRWDKS